MRPDWIVAIFLLASAFSGCSRSEQPAIVTFEQLQQGDFNWDRTPPFVPNETLKPFLDQRVCIDGEYGFTGDGVILLTRPNERILTPLRAIVCNPKAVKPPAATQTVRVSGILRIRPRANLEGRTETVFQLDECTFAPVRQ